MGKPAGNDEKFYVHFKTVVRLPHVLILKKLMNTERDYLINYSFKLEYRAAAHFFA